MREKDLRRSLSILPMGTITKLTDLSPRQIRYYEQQKLVIPKRSQGNRRLYSLNDVDKLLNIKDYLNDGLKINDIKHIIKKEQTSKTQKNNKFNKHISDNEARRLLKKDFLKAGRLESGHSSQRNLF